jgi:Transposase DDE domain
MLKHLVDYVLENNTVTRTLCNGSYDNNNNFRYLVKNNNQPAIKTRRDSKVRPTNCKARNMSVTKQQQNFKKWKNSLSYGDRWMTETVFSSMKRMFVEHVSARKFPNMIREMFLKASLYNMFNGMI